MPYDDARSAEIKKRCDRFLTMHDDPSIAGELTALAAYAGGREKDRYGSGAVVEELEARVAGLLGTEAAVFLPSGTMAQQAALRVWADETGRDTVALHGLAHLERDEDRAVWELHGLRQRFLTHELRQPTVDDLAALSEPLAALTVELPLRSAGCLLPDWADLVALCAAAHERGARVHLDGARLWESTPYLGHDIAEVAALADSVYVSFYKVLGGISGAAVAGPEPFAAQVRAWRQRHGGTLVTQYPAVLSALRGLDEVLPRVPTYVAHAASLAAMAATVPGIRVFPEPPHCNVFTVFADADRDVMNDARCAYAEEHGVWSRDWHQADVPGWSMTECHVGEATLAWTPEQFTAMLADLLDRTRG